MVRPRFRNLAPEQQQVIVQAAIDEFAAHGFHDASLNRVIDAAGISKGSMYYYFDGKDDLFAYVVEAGLRALFAELGPLAVPAETDAEGFWATLADYYRRVVTALLRAPQLTALIRGWIGAAATPAVQQAQGELEREVLPWITQTLAMGQRVGAVRSDLPSSLLIAVVVGLGQAMDTWLLTRQPVEGDPAWLSGTMIDMLRRAVGP